MNPYAEAFLRLIYPATCGVCERLLELEEEGICGVCKSQLEGLRFSLEEAVLPGRFRALDEGWSLYPYASPAKEILAGIKFLKKRWLVRVFREALASLLAAVTSQASYDMLVPIPMDRAKLYEREFNQSELIAGLAAKQSGISLARKTLRKRRSSFPQSQLSREEREVNLRGAFQVWASERIRGRYVLLVDDIFTTGATAEEAARTLKDAGAKRVDLLTLARTEPSA